MVIPTNIEQINKGLSYLLPNKIFLAISVAIEIGYSAFHKQHIPHVGLCLFTNFQKYLRIYVEQWHKQN